MTELPAFPVDFIRLRADVYLYPSLVSNLQSSERLINLFGVKDYVFKCYCLALTLTESQNSLHNTYQPLMMDVSPKLVRDTKKQKNFRSTTDIIQHNRI